MVPVTRSSSARLAQVLERDGLLLVHDAMLPSATAVVVGEPFGGSWWAHPQTHEIFDALQPCYRDATRVKLVVGKVTLVHRRLWPALVAVGSARRAWQMDGLADGSRAMLVRVGRFRRRVAADDLPGPTPSKRAVVELEQRLLVHVADVHTESGVHAKRFESWATFRRRHAVSDLPSASDAMAAFEQIVAPWPPSGRSRPLLPWMT
jgi:hypothetical protein